MSCEVSLHEVTVGFPESNGGRAILDRLDLTVPGGQVTVVMGESGSGKTTLLRVVAGLQAVAAGEVRFGGAVITDRPPEVRDVAMAFQDYALYPLRSVAKNLEIPLEVLGLPREERRRRVGEMLERLGMDGKAAQRVENLSGGEQQRVALGRALIRRPRVLLLDEPLSNVDPGRQQEIVGLLHELLEEVQPTTLLVTHDWREAILLGHRVAVLESGRVSQSGTPRQIYEEPVHLGVLRFSQEGMLNVQAGLTPTADGRMLQSADGRILAEASRPLAAGVYAAVVRPEHLHAGTVGWPARVRRLSPAAGAFLLELEAAGYRWFAQADASMPGAAIGQVQVRLVPGAGWVADAEGRFVARLSRLEVES